MSNREQRLFHYRVIQYCKETWKFATVAVVDSTILINLSLTAHSARELLAYHMESHDVPLVVRAPQVPNHWSTTYITLQRSENITWNITLSLFARQKLNRTSTDSLIVHLIVHYINRKQTLLTKTQAENSTNTHPKVHLWK